MPYKTKKERNEYAKKYYHKQMQKERELTKIQQNEQNNNLTKNDKIEPMIEPNVHKSYYDNVPDEESIDKDDYVIEKTKFYSKLVKLFIGIQNAELAIEDIVVKHGFDPEDVDDMFDFFQMIDRKLAKEEKEEKLKKH